MIPGMMCDERLFASQINELSKRREVHFAKITDHETISELASDVLNNAPPVFALAGLSMGGIVAMEIVSQAPERVERLALLDTNPLAELPDVLKRRGPQIDAIKNAKRNNIDGLQFYAADVGKFINEHPEYKNKIRTIILDPSRAGIAPKTLLKIIAINADRIIYVSCNPATQARDTEEMMKHGYQIKK